MDKPMDDYDKFDVLGQFLIEALKDEPLEVLEDIFAGKNSTGQTRGLYEAIRNLDDASKDIVRDCVTKTAIFGIYSLLMKLEYYNAAEKGIAVTAFGDDICEIADGPLCWYLNGDPYSWEEKFSKFPTLHSVYDKYPAPAKPAEDKKIK